jgi:hypothetical protein
MPGMRRLSLFGLPGLVLAGFVSYFAFGAPQLAAHQPRAAPAQPIDFDHRVHAQTAGADCLFCHRSAVEGGPAGMPAVQQCMACHQVVGTGDRQQEIDKVRKAWMEQQPIDWVRIHRLPDHVVFVHEAHVRAGLSCAACHGDVAGMSRITQVRPLHMNDCVSCHAAMKAPTDCLTCHR